jgi:hypothetical protein
MILFYGPALTLMQLVIFLEQLAELLTINETSSDETSMKANDFLLLLQNPTTSYP